MLGPLLDDRGGRGVLPFERIAQGSSRPVEVAERILADGWTLRGYPAVRLDGAIPWRHESDERRSWNYHLQSWDLLEDLLAAHSQTGNEALLRPAIRVALDWVDRHSHRGEGDLPSPFAWYDMAVGLRAYRLAYLLDAAVAQGCLEEEERERLWQSLDAHRADLADDAKVAFHSNHGFFQVAGQLAMGRRFADRSTAMAEALTQGRERLSRMLRTQFAADGVHREHSPDYHRMVYGTLEAMIACGLVDDPATVEFAATIEESLSWFVLPSGHIANFGDSDSRRIAPDGSDGRGWRTAAMRFVASGGREGSPPDAMVAAFTEGGYFVARSPSPEHPESPSQASYLAQIACFHSRTHKHADDLSILWSDRGADLLVDAGRYGYIGRTEPGSDLWREGHWYSDPFRVYCESTRAHNTVEIDGTNRRRVGAKPYGSALCRWLEGPEGLLAVETEQRPELGVRHARLLVFVPGSWLLVFDWVHDNLRRRHAIRQWFHLGAGLEVRREADGYAVPIPGSREPLRVVSLLPGSTPSRIFLGEREPSIQGWWSPREREIVPNPALCFQQHGAVSVTFATLFSFSTALEARPARSRCSASGRRAQLRWRDEQGDHLVLIERPVQGELDVRHELTRRPRPPAR